MTLTQKLQENFTATIGAVLLACLLAAGLKSGVFTSQEELKAFLSQAGILAPLCFLAVQIIQVILPVLPGGVSCLMGVAIFGSVNGFFLNYAGMVIGSVISFLLARHYGRNLILRLVSEKSFNKYISWTQKGKKFDLLFTLAILLPGAPDDLLCLIAGLTSMSLKKFTAVTLLCRPAALLAYSFGGTMFFQLLSQIF